MSYAHPIGYLGALPSGSPVTAAYQRLNAVLADILLNAPAVVSMMRQPFSASNWRAAKRKLGRSTPQEITSGELQALIVGTMSQAKADLMNAKMFMVSSASSNARLGHVFTALLNTDVELLRQLPEIAGATSGGPRKNDVTKSVAGLGQVIDLQLVTLLWSTLRTWLDLQEQRKQWLREQIALCEELADRGTPCAPERISELRAELEGIENTPFNRLLTIGENGINAAGDAAGKALSAALKAVLIPVGVVAGLAVLWVAWPAISAGAKRGRKAVESRL